MSDSKFEMQCLVELFGHSKIAGKVTEQSIGGATFIRVDVPKTSKREGFTRFYGPGAIYAMTPVDEKIAALMAEQLEVEPVSEWTLQAAMQKLLPSAAAVAPHPDDDDEDEIDDDEADEVVDDEPHEFDGEEPPPSEREKDKQSAAQWARDLLKGEFVIVDTETIGSEADDEIIQIGVIDQTGAVVLDQLIKPDQPILNTQYHGLTDEMVKDAPRFPEAYERIKAALQGKRIVAYNRDFDSKMLYQVCAKHNLEALDDPDEWDCAMEMYAQFNGEWNDYHGNYRWKKLREAVADFGLTQAVAFGGEEHNAVADCRAALAVIKAMALYKADVEKVPARGDSAT